MKCHDKQKIHSHVRNRCAKDELNRKLDSPFALHINTMNQKFICIGSKIIQCWFIYKDIAELLPPVSHNGVSTILTRTFSWRILKDLKSDKKKRLNTFEQKMFLVLCYLFSDS
jgi:hypothetical protein